MKEEDEGEDEERLTAVASHSLLLQMRHRRKPGLDTRADKSSQNSWPANILSPQTVRQTSPFEKGVVTQPNPHSTVHRLLHPSPEMRFASSQPSSPLILTPSPHTGMHAESPGSALYVPSAHSTHGPPFGPVKPTWQTHAVAAALPAGASEFAGHAVHVPSPVAPTSSEYLPAPQSSHSASPVLAWYLPAAHSTQSPPFGPT